MHGNFFLTFHCTSLDWVAEQGTTDLSLRVGLNSGPTTAGVLRGEKARFQLFGDVSGVETNESSREL